VLPASTEVLEQWNDLKEYFISQKDVDYKACELANLYHDNSNRLLTFLKKILQQVSVVNLSFEKNDADITRLFSDLRSLVFMLAARVLKPAAIAETARASKYRQHTRFKIILTTFIDFYRI